MRLGSQSFAKIAEADGGRVPDAVGSSVDEGPVVVAPVTTEQLAGYLGSVLSPDGEDGDEVAEERPVASSNTSVELDDEW